MSNDLFLPRRVEEREEKLLKQVISLRELFESIGGEVLEKRSFEFEITLDLSRQDTLEYIKSLNLDPGFFIENMINKFIISL